MKTKITLLFIAFAMVLSSYAQDPGNCLNFDNILGQNYISVGDIDDGLTQFTIETWINPYGDDVAAFICSHAFEHMEIHTSTGGNLRFIPTNGVFLDVPHSIALNKWTHVACTYNPNISEAHIYINGEEITYILSAGSLSAPIDQGSNNFIVGRRQNATFPITGSMDEFRVWNVARSSEEIQSNFDKSVVPATEENLILYYNFNQGVAGDDNTLITTVTDLTGDYDGTLTNFQLTSSTSNFIESYAMVIPIALDATNVLNSSFTANWQAPTTGEFDEYHLYVATDENFTSFLAGYNPKIVEAGVLNEEITGLSSDISYYYRVTAYNSLFAGQEALSNTIEAHTIQFMINPQIVQIAQPNGSTATLEITTGAEVEWSISELPNWLSSDISSGTGTAIITFTATENIANETRNADVILSGTGMTDQMFNVIQSYSFGNALNFDGVDDYIQLLSAGDGFLGTNTLNESFTIEMMIKTTNTTANKALIAKHSDSGTRAGFFITADANGTLCGGMANDANAWTSITSTKIINDDQWHHVAFVYDTIGSTSTTYLYIDNVLQGSQTGFTAVFNNVVAAAIGNSLFYGAHQINASFDNFRLWNKARSAEDIYNRQFDILDSEEEGIVANYDFNQGVSCDDNTGIDFLTDISANSNNVLLSNFALNTCVSNWVSSEVFNDRYLSLSDENIIWQNSASQTEIELSSNIAWEITCSETWLSFSETLGTGNNTLTISAEENLNPNARLATATVSGHSVAEKTIIITQKSVPPVAGELTFSTNFLGTQTRTHTDNVYELGEITSTDALTGLTIEVIDGNINTSSTNVYYNAGIQGNMVYTGSDNIWYFSPTAAFVWSEGINTLTTQFTDNDGSTLNITVNFTLVQFYTLSFAVVGGNGSISADDGTNTLTSPADVVNGTEVTFTASPNSNYQVKEWVVNASPVVGNTTETYILTVDQNNSVSVEFEPFVGISNEISSTISVYPNPATNYLTIINLDNEINFTITNITGQIIKSGITINNSIVISDLPEGIYHLCIEQSNETIKTVFIKL
ncbi:MAG: T9SS type A sorting domain-containing protein [Bacteroidales bacterium]|nr:T9SS type A sorting domain-containing protein [Bacteroidales bacterium]